MARCPQPGRRDHRGVMEVGWVVCTDVNNLVPFQCLCQDQRGGGVVGSSHEITLPYLPTIQG